MTQVPIDGDDANRIDSTAAIVGPVFAIRPIADDDVSHLGVFRLGEIHGPDRDAPRRARTFVAVADGLVIGAGTLMWSSRHPDLITGTIDVASSSRRRGVGSALLRQLEAAADRPLVFNVERTIGSTLFLESAGFAVAVTSVTSRVVVGDALAALDDVLTPVTPATQIAGVDRISDAIAELYDQIYRARHTWAGRYTPPANAPWIGFAGSPLDVPGTIQIARRNDELIAVASLHAGQFAAGADAFLAPTSVLHGEFEDRVAILARLLHACLTAGLREGIRVINVEFDTPYDDLVALVSSWPVRNRVTRDAWLRRSP